MTQNDIDRDDEIDLFELFATLWDSKLTIAGITSLFGTLGLATAFIFPASYTYKLELQPALESEFLPFGQVNDLLAKTGGVAANYAVNAGSVYNAFIQEISDKQEFKSVILNEPGIKVDLRAGGSEIEVESAIREYLKKFSINRNTARDPGPVPYHLNLTWDDEDEAIFLMSRAISDSLANTKARVIQDIRVIAQSKLETMQRDMENLKNRKDALSEFGVSVMEQRVAILQEQSAIAKEMGIEGTQVQRFDAANGIYPLDFDSNGTPLYLRGYRVLDQEIANLKEKISKKEILGYEPYLSAERDLLLLEKDQSVAQLQNQVEALQNATDAKNWVSYDLDIAEPVKKPSKALILAGAVLLGLFISVIYVFVQNHKKNKAVV